MRASTRSSSGLRRSSSHAMGGSSGRPSANCAGADYERRRKKNGHDPGTPLPSNRPEPDRRIDGYRRWTGPGTRRLPLGLSSRLHCDKPLCTRAPDYRTLLKKLRTTDPPRPPPQRRILSTEPITNWEGLVRRSFDDPDLHAPGGESAEQVLCRAHAALEDIFKREHRSPLVVTHGNVMALLLHSVDATFGYPGWKSLSNPDVYILSYNPDCGRMFQRVWRP